MRKETLSTLFLLTLVAGCERVPVLEARVQGEGLAPILAYQVPGKSPQYWTIEDDWHRLFMAARARPERLLFFIRTHDDPSSSPPGTWWLAGRLVLQSAIPLTIEAPRTNQRSSIFGHRKRGIFQNACAEARRLSAVGRLQPFAQ